MKTSILHDALSMATLAILAGTPGTALAAEPPGAANQQVRPFEAGSLVESDFHLPAGQLAVALDAFERQSGIELRYQIADVTGKQARAVHGRMAWPEALPQLLQGSGLGYRQIDGRTVVIEVSAKTAVDLAAITVTGTRIRGGTSPSPVITIGSEDIREQGFTDLGQVIRSVPQNFAGGQNPGVAAGAETGPAGIANRNVTGGSSLNLRGLGPDATLTLLNGRRLAYGGYVQTVDISAIPVEAVDRIEIVADGASAIYDSDAVGGVANVILRRDYEGATIGALYGGTTDGGMGTRQYNATAGTTWSSGGLIATYKYASVDPIRADQRDYTAHMPPPTTIYPGSTLRSELFSAHQALGDAMELRLDALRTEREQLSYSYYSGISSFYSRFSPETTTTLVAPALEMSLPNDWRLSLGASWGRDERTLQEFRMSTTTGEGARSPYDDCFCNRSRTYEVGAEGPLFHLGGGDARLAVGAGHRWNGFADRLLTTGDNLIEGAEGSRFAYAELGMPLLGGATGAARESARLSLTAALRREDYDSFGSVVTPKLGLVYDPTGDYTLKASWGRSFKAPTLLQRYQEKGAVLDSAIYYGGDPGQTVLATFGGNPDLEPERANTRTASLAVHPRALAAFEAELTLFDIDYTDRVVQPIGNFGETLTNPAYSRYVDLSPTPEEQARLIDTTAGFYNYTGSAYDPGNVVALFYAHFVNVARQRIRGLDLSGSYGFDIGAGRLTFRGSGSWLDSTQKNSPEDSAFDLAGTLYSPAKIKSRVGLVWLQGGLTASAFANYTSGVSDALTGFKTASFATLDANLRYSIDDSAGSRSGWDFALSAHNLFDRAPPLHPNIDPARVPYDSTNYSAIGRYLSVSVARRF
jgi:iron complex outermembrane receptor protein